MIDGVDIKNFAVSNLRSQIGMVMQEPLLFNDTIKNNILYGNRNASDQEIYEAALKANALGFIEQEDDARDAQVQLKIENDFTAKIQEISKEFPNFRRIYEEFKT